MQIKTKLQKVWVEPMVVSKYYLVQFCAQLAATSGKRQEMGSYKLSHCTIENF